jgi:hypothetical protein
MARRKKLYKGSNDALLYATRGERHNAEVFNLVAHLTAEQLRLRQEVGLPCCGYKTAEVFEFPDRNKKKAINL